LIGDKLGGAIARFSGSHPWITALGTVLLFGTIAFLALRASRAIGESEPNPTQLPG
jgi:hypothetical protein